MELGPILLPIVGLALLLCFSAFFSGSETALCALSRAQIERLRHEGTGSSAAVVRFLDDPRRLFITILLGNTFVNIAFATTTAVLIYQVLGSGPSGLTTTLVVLGITILLLLFGEITPKTLAIRHPEGFSLAVARPLWLFSIVILPLRKLLRWVTDLLISLVSSNAAAAAVPVTGDDIRALLEEEDETAMVSEEREILRRILELRDIEAHEIMVPRERMVSITTRATIQETLDLARRVGLSRIPVFRSDEDADAQREAHAAAEQGGELCGFFHVKDWLVWRHAGIRDQTLADFLATREAEPAAAHANTLVRELHFAAQTTKLAELFAELTREKTKIVILTNDDGVVSGVLSLEDIVEEVVGEIIDEHDVAAPDPEFYRPTDDPRVVEVAGRLGIRAFNRACGLEINEEAARTIGQYALGLFGHFPATGESCVDENGVAFEVRAAVGERIARLLVTLPEEAGRGDAS